MAKRKKRLEKGISSLKHQIIEHEIKRHEAASLGKEERVHYYSVELAGLKKTLQEKLRKKHRKG